MTVQLAFRAVVSTLLFAAVTARAEVGVTPTEVLLGESTNVSGPSPSQSVAMKNGSDLYFKGLNARGGVNGRKIRVIDYDDGYDPKRSAANAQKLVHEDKVFALFQFYGTPTVQAVLPLVDTEHVPFISPTSGSDALRSKQEVFPVRASAGAEAHEMLKLLEQRKIEDIGLFYQNDAFGIAGRSVIQKGLAGRAGKLVMGSYLRDVGDVEPGLAEILKTKPKAVIIWGLAKPASTFIRRAVEKDYRPLFIITSSAAQSDFNSAVKDLDVEIVTGRSAPPLSDSSVELVRRYFKEAKDAGVKPEMTHWQGFLDAAVMAEALRAAGKDLTRPSLIKAMNGMSALDLEGVHLSYAPGAHTGLTQAWLEPVPTKHAGH